MHVRRPTTGPRSARTRSTGPASPRPHPAPWVAPKTPEEKAAEVERDRAYKESLGKIPDSKTSSDPWGGFRGAEAPKTTKSLAKPKTRTGSTAN